MTGVWASWDDGEEGLPMAQTKGLQRSQWSGGFSEQPSQRVIAELLVSSPLISAHFSLRFCLP